MAEIEILLNDNTTPHLKKTVPLPPPPDKLHFTVKDFTNEPHKFRSRPWRSANAWYSVWNALRWVCTHAEKPPHRWAATTDLLVIPQAGNDLNAFYDRRSIQFFQAPDPTSKKMIFTVESTDIVTHELGHALLDAFRPDTWNAPSLEVWSFHEAFADMVAVISILQHHEVIEELLSSTKLAIRKSNFVSRLAEEVGRGIYGYTGGRGGRSPSYLRDASNQFKYVPPHQLPQDAPHDQLAAECHSFGRVFLGALYDILVDMYRQSTASGMQVNGALVNARDTLSKYLLKAVANAPLAGNFYQSVAQTMLWVDSLHGRVFANVLQEAFVKRNILTMKMLDLPASVPDCPSNENSLSISRTKTVRLADHFIRAQADNSLYDVEIDLPIQSSFLYNNGVPVVAILSSEAEVLQAAQHFVDFLHQTDAVGDGPEKPFSIVDGKLVRTHFS